MKVATLNATGNVLRLAKYELSPGNYLAQFSGSGLSKAEEFVKSNDAEAIILNETEINERPSLSGLSCRLQPLSHKNGTILTLLIKPRSSNPQDCIDRILLELETIFGKHYSTRISPVDDSKLKWTLTLKSSIEELRLSKDLTAYGWSLLSQLVIYFVTSLVLQFKWNLGKFSAKQYRSDLVKNSDFQKFDETLRMVVDCSQDQANQICCLLDQKFKNEEIFYGTHLSEHALMTCVVQSATNNQHIHFIDGANGGYAMAAIKMKSQIQASND